MLLIQLTGLSGAGKTTLSQRAKAWLEKLGYAVEVLDGDVCRKHFWPELTFSAKDRQESIRRLAYLAHLFGTRNDVVLLAAINPYEAIRAEVASRYPFVRTVYVHCEVPILIERDTKGLYKRALLPDHHPDKLINLTGINDCYEEPQLPDLRLNTGQFSVEECTAQLVNYIRNTLPDLLNAGGTAGG